jgi:hypothetical protein
MFKLHLEYAKISMNGCGIMSKYLDALFLSDYKFEEDILSSNLFISFDSLSALRKDYKNILDKIKVNDCFEIKYINNKELNEGYEEEKYILLINNVYYFVRLVLSDKKLYDVLIYTVDDLDKYLRIFFSHYEYKITDDVEKKLEEDGIRFLIDLSKDGYYIIKANKAFYNMMMYEDWDFYNKYLNKLKLKMNSTDILLSKNLTLYKSDSSSYYLNYEIDRINDNVILVREVVL